ncbi:LOW QUALITY PROTEIN: cysteine-tryptophan domain-containing zinc finger protein 7-like [Prosopis cineraria]|uniref:LOW QUALITY PROTEIN: cysteine-tryptophan domain-containing zinc finger protein 7-like n=1 Tax=Prosopis cineraria TaxID=364024 RepID=UPI002410ACB0|nr:LOW QUALITY PROTEIN: cysteine-tryptophan domain-containing zinc finger protein 7-like [Prosopis cineraria]
MEVGNIGWVGNMEENTVLEEGEACYNKDRDDNIDPDSLSYIDERIQHVLGHFQKDFEGGVSAEKLGAKFGGYGSFLPAYECSPFRSHPKASQRNYMSPKSPSHHHEKAASNNSTAPSHVPPSTRRGSAPCSTNSLQNARTFSVDDSTNKGVGISSNIGAERCSLNDDSTHKSGKSTEQRTLKFRIKMKYDNLAQKNAAIYSGLGLDISPSSSMENSPVETAGMPPVSQQIGEESPAGIIQAMTSFPIPGGVLMSPLQDSMLYLTRREKILGDSKSLSALNGQEHCSLSTDESDSIIREEDVLKKRKVRILHPKKRLGKTPERKDFLFNDLKSTLCLVHFVMMVKMEIIGRASEVSKKVNKHGANSRMVSTEAVKEEVLESMSGQDFEKSSKKHMGNSSMRRVIEHNLANSLKNNCVGPNNNAHYKGPINSQKADVDVINCFIEDSQKVETNRKGKPLSDGKHKSKGDQSPSKTGGISKTDSFKAGSNAMANNKKSSSFGDDSKSKMAKTKSSMDNNAGGNSSHSLKGDKPECIVDGTDPVDGSTYDDFTNGSAFEVKMKERQSSDKMDKLMCDPGIKDALNACPVAGNKSALEMVQMAAASQLIEDNWVCCDHCQKWRLLPVGIKPEQLPEKWLCSMLNWLPPGMNRCDISEEMTTKALYASCQMSNSEGLNNIQSNAFGAAIGVRSADAPQLGHSHQNSRSDALSDQRKKKLGSKEKKKAEICIDSLLSSDSTQNHAEESGKILRHQHPAEGNLMRKPVSQHGKLNNLMEVKHMPKEKRKNEWRYCIIFKVKLKRKMEADRNQPRTPKKLKTGDIYIANRQLSLSVDLENAVRNSRNGFPVKANGEDVQKHDDNGDSKTVETIAYMLHVQHGCVKKQGTAQLHFLEKLVKVKEEENLIQDLEDGNKANTVCTESRNGKLKVLSPSVGEEKRETLSGSIIACESKRGDTCIEHQIHASSNGDVGTLMKISADARSKGGVNCGSGISGSDWQLPVTTPNSGFEFESNETFFEAALKFLHGASLLENFLKESSKHGNISQMQAYMTAAKLFTSCANEYERRHETAAAALAYKCMEVAYMRVVYSKHSSINRDRDELQSTLQMVPQGESPSSSASDVDNLNNQAPVDRFTLLRGTGTHVAGNQVISAQHRSNFARLLDFTQDVNYAMEASRKCQCAFAAANMIMEEARNGDCITSMRKVIDLSFQDVDELVGLVWTATKAISRAHLSGARD